MVAVHYAFMVQGHDVQWLFKLIKIAGILSTLNLSAAIVAKHNFRSTTFFSFCQLFLFLQYTILGCYRTFASCCMSLCIRQVTSQWLLSISLIFC